jgi:hypothetical protein
VQDEVVRQVFRIRDRITSALDELNYGRTISIAEISQRIRPAAIAMERGLREDGPLRIGKSHDWRRTMKETPAGSQWQSRARPTAFNRFAHLSPPEV